MRYVRQAVYLSSKLLQGILQFEGKFKQYHISLYINIQCCWQCYINVRLLHKLRGYKDRSKYRHKDFIRSSSMGKICYWIIITYHWNHTLALNTTELELSYSYMGILTENIPAMQTLEPCPPRQHSRCVSPLLQKLRRKLQHSMPKNYNTFQTIWNCHKHM